MEIISVENNKFQVKIPSLLELPKNIDFSDLRDYQLDSALDILSHSNGLVSLFTGFGKTFLISWICKYIPRPILITEPTNTLIEELQSRMDSMGIDQTDIHLINPTGYMARVNRDDSWLTGVKTVLSDEMMSVTQSIKDLFLLMPNVERVYGFSATSDKHKNYRMDVLRNFRYHDDTCEILEYYGPTITYAQKKKDIEIIEDELHLGGSHWTLEDYADWKYTQATNKVFKSKELPNYLVRCIERCDEPILMPFINRKHVDWLLKNPILSRFRLALWMAGSLELNTGKVFTDKDPWTLADGTKMSVYDTVKYMIEFNKVNIIFCSSVGFKGVDTKINNMILMVGSNAGNVIQMIGRVRGDHPRIFLPKNLDQNELYNHSREKRLKWIKSMQEKQLGETLTDPYDSASLFDLL